MAFTYYGHMVGTKIVGVLRVDDGETVDPTLETAFLVDWLTRPALPNAACEYHLVDGAITVVDPRTLAEAKTARVAMMRDARDAAINGAFTWDGSGFDADQVSQTRILGLKVASTDAAFTPKAWRLADNTWRVLSAADAADVWTALQAHVAGHFTTFAQRDAAIAAATTVAAVNSITWA